MAVVEDVVLEERRVGDCRDGEYEMFFLLGSDTLTFADIRNRTSRSCSSCSHAWPWAPEG